MTQNISLHSINEIQFYSEIKYHTTIKKTNLQTKKYTTIVMSISPVDDSLVIEVTTN